MGTLIDTARLRMREFTCDDAPFILRLVNEPAWLEFIGDKQVHSEADARGYLERGPLASYAEHGHGLWGVGRIDSADLIGMCGLIRRASLDDVDLGFAFLRDHWGRGYAVEAAAAVLTHGHEALGLRRIVAITMPENRRSIAVLERIGMTFETLCTGVDGAAELALYAHIRPSHRTLPA